MSNTPGFLPCKAVLSNCRHRYCESSTKLKNCRSKDFFKTFRCVANQFGFDTLWRFIANTGQHMGNLFYVWGGNSFTQCCLIDSDINLVLKTVASPLRLFLVGFVELLNHSHPFSWFHLFSTPTTWPTRSGVLDEAPNPAGHLDH